MIETTFDESGIKDSTSHTKDEVFEPEITGEYLNGSKKYLEQMRNVVANSTNPYLPTEIDSPILDDSGYKILIQRINQPGSNQYTLYIDGPQSNQSGVDLIINPELIVRGYVGNKSSGHNVAKPLRNVSGILAPIEDAFCQAIADASIDKRTAIREVSTYHTPDSRFVQNYIRRGYVPEDQGNGKIYLKKYFTAKNNDR